jgi:hypothetical protein
MKRRVAGHNARAFRAHGELARDSHAHCHFAATALQNSCDPGGVHWRCLAAGVAHPTEAGATLKHFGKFASSPVPTRCGHGAVGTAAQEWRASATPVGPGRHTPVHSRQGGQKPRGMEHLTAAGPSEARKSPALGGAVRQLHALHMICFQLGIRKGPLGVLSTVAPGIVWRFGFEAAYRARPVRVGLAPTFTFAT